MWPVIDFVLLTASLLAWSLNTRRIASVSYTGLLSGPVVIGAIASGVGLRNALLVPAALALVVAAAAGVMNPR